ncbi:MAG TPA: PTS sugar transporter subunit IIC [Firmicutes bacterium]|nr:PTS sugar transporter subunit IIC [Candidatus Fermentithermobacillaceae bacterium]
MEVKKGFIERWLVPVFERVGSNRHMVVLRESFLLVIPIILIGSVFNILPNVPGLSKLFAPYAAFLTSITQITYGAMAVYLTILLSHNLAKSYDLDPINPSIVSLIAFLVSGLTLKDVDGVFYLSMEWLGPWGIFGAILISFYATELYRICLKRGLYWKPPQGVPKGVGKFVEAIVPEALILTPVVSCLALGVKIPTVLGIAFRPLLKMADSYPAFLLALFVEHLTWYLGIHCFAAIGPAYFPFLISNTAANATAIAKGLAAPFVATFETYFGGGGGGTGDHFPLVLFGLRSKSKTLRTVSKAALVPTLLEINEPVLFGFPIILNPVFFVPQCIIAPLCRSLAYVLTSAGLVAKSSVSFFAFVPSPIIWYFGTLDWRVIPWGLLIGYILPGIGYYPFFKVWERHMVQEEAKNMEQEADMR